MILFGLGAQTYILTRSRGMSHSVSPATSQVVARRTTFDGIHIHLWDDGGLTGLLGQRMEGVPARCKRSSALAAGWLFMGEVSLYEISELGELYKAARKAVSLDGLPGTLRRLFSAGSPPPKQKFTWQTLSTDQSGKPTERIARLPRIRWPGLVVWDYCGGSNSSRGRYELVSEVSHNSGTYESTGFRFTTQDQAWAHLNNLPS